MIYLPTNLTEAGRKNLQDFIVDKTKPELVLENAAAAYFNEIGNFRHFDRDNTSDPIAVIEIGSYATKSGNPETYWLMADQIGWIEDEDGI